ncbi:MAG: PAS domain S-box protein, partial [Dehalococcoidia bacterium]|nr:PAS domain S-box protein [Dehalococcoidia bacterium]
MDRTLVRQLRALGIDPTEASASPEVLARLLGQVSRTYALQRRLRQRLREQGRDPEADGAPDATSVPSRFERFFHLASDAMFTATLDGRITGANEALAEMTGLAREDLIGRTVASIVAPTSLEPMLEMRRTKFRDPEAVTRYDVELLHVDGSVVLVELASQFERLDGRPYEILAIARDIRERRARETALRDQAERDPLTG